MVLVHGTPTWSFEWRHVIRAFASTHRCIAPDHLGFGLSDRPTDAPYTPEWHADNFAAFIDRLEVEKLSLVVHDFGGPIALAWALRNPNRVARLVVVNTWMWSFRGDRSMELRGRIAGGAFGRMLYRWANFSLRVITPSAYGDRQRLTPAIHRQYLDRFPDRWSRGAVLWPLARALNGSADFYDSLWQQRERFTDVPALIVWGMKDTAFQPHQLERWKRTLPHASVVEIADAGHWPHEEAPDEVVAAIRSATG